MISGPSQARAYSQALEFLQDYKDFIQTDGYIGYEALGNTPGIIHVGCMSHVRRKFMDVLKISKKDKEDLRQLMPQYIDPALLTSSSAS